MIVEYETPLKKVAEQFVPHQQVKRFSLWLDKIVYSYTYSV